MEAVITFLVSFSISLLAVPIVIRISERRNLYELPASRKIHQRITPSRGGIAIFIGLLIGCGVSLYSDVQFFKIVCVLSVPFAVGILDDHFHLKPLTKLGCQIATAALIYSLLDVRLGSFYGLINYQFGPFLSFIVSGLTIVILINSFNLIDGIDGLAASVSSVILVFYSFWFFLVNDSFYAMLALGASGSILAFLIFNWEPSKIFMGDTGSLVIGTLLSILTLRFINENYTLSSEYSVWKFYATIPTAILLLIIPIVDTVRVIIIRIRLGISPLSADKRHIHHCLLELGCSHRSAVLIIIGIQIGFLGIALYLRESSNWLSLAICVGLAIALCVLLQFMLSRQMISKSLAQE